MKLLQELSCADQLITGPYPKELNDNILLGEYANPTFLAISDVQNGWITVQINSFQKLYDWAEIISKELNTSFIQIIGQTVSDVYYFLLYENGVLRREIEIYHGELDNITDKGEKFPFEKPSLVPINEGDYKDIFDRDTLEFYCKEFGFDLFEYPEPDLYFILKKKNLGTTIKKYVLANQPKPWWKFW